MVVVDGSVNDFWLSGAGTDWCSLTGAARSSVLAVARAANCFSRSLLLPVFAQKSSHLSVILS